MLQGNGKCFPSNEYIRPIPPTSDGVGGMGLLTSQWWKMSYADAHRISDAAVGSSSRVGPAYMQPADSFERSRSSRHFP